jgi:hypothetical protein
MAVMDRHHPFLEIGIRTSDTQAVAASSMEKFPDRRSPSHNRTRSGKIYFCCRPLRFYKSVKFLGGVDNDDLDRILIGPELHSKLILKLNE